MAIAAVLFAVARRFFRPLRSLTAYRGEAKADLARTRDAIREANAAIDAEEALAPLRAALADMPLPPGCSLAMLPGSDLLMEIRAGGIPAETIRVAYGRRLLPNGRGPGRQDVAPVWTLTRGARPPEQFGDMAACFDRLRRIASRPGVDAED